MQERFDLNKTQGASTPEEVKRMQIIPYASAVCSIMYAVRCTRPDVAFAQNITSRFQQNPGECHWTAVKNILKYLLNTKDMFVVYGGNPKAKLRVDCYCNAGFETDIDAALLIANEPGVQMGVKHYHRSNLLKVQTDDNLAYPFTKALPKGMTTSVENNSVFMLIELKALYSKQAEQELLQTMRIFTRASCVKVKSEYDSFVQNYNRHIMGKTVNELHAMLKLHEETLPKKVAAPALHAIRAGKVQKNKNKKPSKAAKGVQGKGKGKKAYANAEPSYAPKPKNLPPPKKDNPAKDAICHHYGEVGHWRRNCPTYLTELLKKKQLAQGASTSGIFTIELYSFPSTSWVYDTGCGTHICNTTQGLRGSKKLNPRALSLYMGNGQRAAVEAIGNYHLCLLSGLVIVLNNCHYAPSITRGIISVSRLYEDSFINRFELNNAISVSKNNVVYFTTIPRDGIYEIEMSCSNTNDSPMYVVSNKRAKLNLDSSLL
ncbi:zinc finger, CCHC-type containing protein [Tanacetum coccineum]